MNSVKIDQVKINEEAFFRISNNDQMRPFFMSIVSDSNHWMFISSNGGLTAGRQNAEFSLFPYYTDDKITETTETTGSKSIFWIEKDGEKHLWEPFSIRWKGKYKTSNNLYKNLYGNKVIFEEINHDLGVTFQYQWNSTNTYGFVRKSKLINNSAEELKITFLDGIQNIIPAGIGSDLQNAYSNLVDAYKRTELDTKSGLGVFALSAIIVDRAEPSEALKTNVAWSLGLNKPTHLLSSLQLEKFRNGEAVTQETDVKAEKGAYFLSQTLTLKAGEEKDWLMVADVNKNHSQVAELSHKIINDKNLYNTVLEKIEAGTKRLIALNSSADGVQLTNDNLRDTRHFANTLFNIMRGGIFDDNYKIEKWDFADYLKKANAQVFQNAEKPLAQLDDTFTLFDLRKIVNKSEDVDFQRLATEYMPLMFSRRHGDPSRPWNKFSINTKNEDGSKKLDYEGNWRDIFQNWEALAISYPEFMESMITKFLNATTFDGYNPYRVTKGGFDWETIEPDDPWSYIGYWGDHQIIYLLKFLEFLEDRKPGKLAEFFNKDRFVYANVPYRIKTYKDILKDPKDTIEFDLPLDEKIRVLRDKLGADGALLRSQNDEIIRVNFIEKILATVLAKMSNLIPEGGIWMNTQRPEWNDANNALVGNGVSMVTLYYLRRFLNFFSEVLKKADDTEYKVSNEVVDFYKQTRLVLEENQYLLEGKISDKDRKMVMDKLGQAASEFREQVYERAFWGKKRSISLDGLKRFVDLGLNFLEHSIRANKRTDNLYHGYNLMSVEGDGVAISYLSEMLEGQVAVLSSKYLKPTEVVEVLDGMKASKLFRKDQYSYILYPNKNIAGFFDRNNVPKASVEKSELLLKMLKEHDTSIIEKDINGAYHFNGNFKNASDLKTALAKLSDTEYKDLAEQDDFLLLKVFEEVFNHKAFTGRSGTFFGYEGLGSIYWHMVSKLVLAIQESALDAIAQKASAETVGKLLEHYYEAVAGIGVHKSPTLYGAFPTDPYSHTPGGKGAQQPGMTGQVKEDVISRFGELGAFVHEGKMVFNPCLLLKNEFLTEAKTFTYVDVHSEVKTIDLIPNQLAFTYCQVPVIYEIADKNKMEVSVNGKIETVDGLILNTDLSQKVFDRTDEVQQIKVLLEASILK